MLPSYFQVRKHLVWCLSPRTKDLNIYRNATLISQLMKTMEQVVQSPGERLMTTLSANRTENAELSLNLNCYAGDTIQYYMGLRIHASAAQSVGN